MPNNRPVLPSSQVPADPAPARVRGRTASIAQQAPTFDVNPQARPSQQVRQVQEQGSQFDAIARQQLGDISAEQTGVESQLAGAQQERGDILGEQQEEIQGITAANAQRRTRVQGELRDAKVNPRRYWENQNAFSQILRSVALIGDGYLRGTREGSIGVKERIDAAIQQDIQAQMQNRQELKEELAGIADDEQRALHSVRIQGELSLAKNQAVIAGIEGKIASLERQRRDTSGLREIVRQQKGDVINTINTLSQIDTREQQVAIARRKARAARAAAQQPAAQPSGIKPLSQVSSEERTIAKQLGVIRAVQTPDGQFVEVLDVDAANERISQIVSRAQGAGEGLDPAQASEAAALFNALGRLPKGSSLAKLVPGSVTQLSQTALRNAQVPDAESLAKGLRADVIPDAPKPTQLEEQQQLEQAASGFSALSGVAGVFQEQERAKEQVKQQRAQAQAVVRKAGFVGVAPDGSIDLTPRVGGKKSDISQLTEARRAVVAAGVLAAKTSAASKLFDEMIRVGEEKGEGSQEFLNARAEYRKRSIELVIDAAKQRFDGVLSDQDVANTAATTGLNPARVTSLLQRDKEGKIVGNLADFSSEFAKVAFEGIDPKQQNLATMTSLRGEALRKEREARNAVGQFLKSQLPPEDHAVADLIANAPLSTAGSRTTETGEVSTPREKEAGVRGEALQRAAAAAKGGAFSKTNAKAAGDAVFRVLKPASGDKQTAIAKRWTRVANSAVAQTTLEKLDTEAAFDRFLSSKPKGTDERYLAGQVTVSAPDGKKYSVSRRDALAVMAQYSDKKKASRALKILDEATKQRRRLKTDIRVLGPKRTALALKALEQTYRDVYKGKLFSPPLKLGK